MRCAGFTPCNLQRIACNLRHTVIVERRRLHTAPLRAACYAACSDLLASPHDLDPRQLLASRRGCLAGLPWGAELETSAAALAAASLEELRAGFSTLFEVGDQGPPVPIRESLRPARAAGAREEVVRFYEFFGYAPGERFAWQPDHLSIELEFLHVLCVQEANAVDDGGARPFELAQIDFASRHPAAWLPAFAADAARQAPGSPYAAAAAAVAGFVAADLEWQGATLGAR
jgi:DMSO reductase family type II enzyme chaperone